MIAAIAILFGVVALIAFALCAIAPLVTDDLPSHDREGVDL